MAVIHPPSEPTHVLPHARFTSLATPSRGDTRDTSVWSVELLPNTPAAPHELTREEVFVILSGAARVSLGEEQREVRAGDVIVVPPDTPFALECAGDTPLRAICCLPVGGQARVDGKTFPPPWSL